jgi:hypothetical protein
MDDAMKSRAIIITFPDTKLLMIYVIKACAMALKTPKVNSQWKEAVQSTIMLVLVLL